MKNSVKLRVRVSQSDSHYAGNLVSGAKILELFGDAATELLIRHDGDEGLLRAYDNVEFLAPVRAGDYLEIEAEITRVGNTSRSMSFEARKMIAADSLQTSRAEVLKDSLLVAKASGTCVVPKSRQSSR